MIVTYDLDELLVKPARSKSKAMGSCFSSEIEDKFFKHPFNEVYDLLVYGYIQRFDEDIATEIIDIVLKYIDRRRWGKVFGGSSLKNMNGDPFDALDLDGIEKKISVKSQGLKYEVEVLSLSQQLDCKLMENE